MYLRTAPPPRSPFRVRLAVDLPLIALTGAIGLGTEFVGKEQRWAGCGACDPAQINTLDRRVLDNHDHGARTYSDIGLYTAIGLPFALDLGDSLIQRARDGSPARGRHMRAWGSDVVILLETFAVNYATTNVVKFAVRRPRPYSYDADSEVADPTENDARLSFFSGHASLSFAMAAAYASVFQARHPRSRFIAPVWVLGMTVASTTALARVAAGKHFWTDIIVGAAVGSAIGVAIPALHREAVTEAVTDARTRVRVVQVAILMALIDGRVTPRKCAVLRRLTATLDVYEPRETNVHQFAAGRLWRMKLTSTAPRAWPPG